MTHRPDIQQMITQLTSEHDHRETHTHDIGRWTGGSHTLGDPTEKFAIRTSVPAAHVTRAPALVEQLLGNDPAGSGAESGSPPVSKPAARIEAIDTLMLIDHEAADWIRRLGEDDPGDTIDHVTGLPVRGSGTIRCLRKLNGLRPSSRHCGQAQPMRAEKGVAPTCCPRHHLEHDIRTWWHQARIIAGYDMAAFRPHTNTCPVCEHRGGLRLRIDSALCVECRSTWDQTSIGLLAEHIRTENDEITQQAG